jgi:hypothetical protein
MPKDRGQAGEWDSVAELAVRDSPSKARQSKREKRAKAAKPAVGDTDVEDMVGEDATCSTRQV